MKSSPPCQDLHHCTPSNTYSYPWQLRLVNGPLLENSKVDAQYLGARNVALTSNVSEGPARLTPALGGCSVNLHQPEDAMSMPSSSQSFEQTYALPRSQPPLAIFPMATPTFSPLHTMTSLPPAPVFIPTASSSIDQQQPPVYLPSSPVVLPIETSSTPHISFPLPARNLAEPPSSMNPLPNP